MLTTARHNSQLKVKGGANASPADNELVGIPGLYQGALLTVTFQNRH